MFKFVEPPENDEKPENQKSRVKFKIMSLKVNGQMDYVPEMVSDAAGVAEWYLHLFHLMLPSRNFMIFLRLLPF